MKKNEIYVEVKNKEQAETYKKVLEAMGEPISGHYKPYTDRHNRLVFYQSDWTVGYGQDKKKITFGELIDLLQRKPLFKTTNGIDIFERDIFYWVTKLPGRYSNPIESIMIDNIPESDLFTFDTREAALEWIESQKPKEKKINIGSVECTITKNGISFNNSVQFLMESSITNIYKAMEELKNG